MQYKRLTASSSLLHNFQPIRKTNKSPTTGGRGLGLFEDWVFSFCYQETKLKMVSLNKNETKTGRKSSRGNAFLRSTHSSPPPTGSLRCRHRSCSWHAQYLAFGPQAGRHVLRWRWGWDLGWERSYTTCSPSQGNVPLQPRGTPALRDWRAGSETCRGEEGSVQLSLSLSHQGLQ